ncbi:carboxypeptidase-like regulatory domain-containing protein [Flavobacterium sp. P21]|uniref:carboxypeptidase-like regulatory domain-containing protein n=1 Tax=Flavobacterium sp. P21 TaxID=3423948 RepID=UPI003D666017
MNKLLLFLFISSISFSQSIYKGNVSSDGQPVPGAYVCVVNTKNCVSTDFDGNYSIEVREGDELSISYLGMKTKIFRISTRTFLENDERVTPIESNDYLEKLEKTVDSLQSSKPSGYFEFDLNRDVDRSDILNITRKEHGFYNLKYKNQYNRIAFEVAQELLVSTPFRLPKYQNEYAQGRSQNGTLIYQAPQTNEIFSWGPNVSTLQYSQNASEYYPQGDIENRSSAGASQLELYNPNHFFQNAIESKTALNAQIIGPKQNMLHIRFAYKTGNIAIPDTRNNEITTSLKYFRKVSDKSTIETLLTYNDFTNNLSNSNFGINKIIFANAVTPIHFDTGLASVLSNGQQRSFSAFENNPYYLLENNLDENKSKTLSFNFNHTYKGWHNENKITASFQSSEITNTNGQAFYSAGIIAPNFNERTEKFKTASASDVCKHTNGDLVIESKIDFRFSDRELNRDYFSGFTSSADFPKNSQIKNNLNVAQDRFEVFYNVNGAYVLTNIIGYADLFLKAKSDLNYSSTVQNHLMTNYFGSAELRNLFDSNLSFTLDHGYNETEPSLQNNNLNFNSSRYQINQFKELENGLELITSRGAVPTKEQITNLKLSCNFRYLNLNLVYYHKKVDNLYTPIFNSNTVSWSPDVNYKQNGIEFDIQKPRFYNRNVNYNFNLNFTYYKNEVTSLNNNQARIPFAGFADVNKNYIVGQPLGVIVGNGYLRDSKNNIIIDDSGFPIKDSNPKILGNPNPDFVVGFYNCFTYKDLKLSLTFEWSQGGEIWNGTQQTLNYYGKSAVTGSQRNTTNYIFDGVTQAGLPNTKAVSFYDVNLPVEQNRWARYGIDGVAEDAIEDATYFRLSSITLSYSKMTNWTRNNLNYSVAIFMNNAFIMAKSKSAFSNNSMFNSIDTTGLDYFNSPMMQSFGSSLTIKF